MLTRVAAQVSRGKKRMLRTMSSSPFYDFSAKDLSGNDKKLGDLCSGKPVRQ